MQCFKRLGAERAMIIYRRSEEEMPARIEEVKHAKEEGVEFLTLHNPIEYIADEQGCVKQVILQKMELGEPDASGRRKKNPVLQNVSRAFLFYLFYFLVTTLFLTGCVKQVILQKMELGEPDASGRRSPVAIPGATETIDIDLAIVSVGVSPNPIVPSSIKGLELGRKGTIAVDENMASSIPMIYAGGDIVRGGATVITCGHFFFRTTVDNHGAFGTQTFGRTDRVHGCVAATDYCYILTESYRSIRVFAGCIH